ncbi:hypothetical protein [Pectobacterium aroidearum]|uniref:hypothetical protein n=1 Tax=Pectobacterium aroidearum TaxID=1201031 RepID=UPI001CD74515|nr:hypothetical protein [Pectobacterium aroidearum]
MSFITPFMVVALMVVVAIIIKKVTRRTTTTTNNVSHDNLSAEALEYVVFLLKRNGYEITPHGSGVVLMSIVSGYTKEETFSYVGLISLAQHAYDSGNNVIMLADVASRGLAIAKITNELFKAGKIREELYINDISALSKIINIDDKQEETILLVLENDPAANADRVANPI